MAIVDVYVPQMGEGLTEVRVLEFHKAPGSTVHRDEILYSMETDKATLEVESPHSGKLTEWLAAEGDVLPVGAPIARMETSDTVVNNAATPATEGSQSTTIPPRTRAYCKEKGISDDEMRRIPAAGPKLMPSDVDLFLSKGSSAERSNELYSEHPLTPQQRAFAYRIRRSAQVVVPATIRRPVQLTQLSAFVAAKREQSAIRPTEFQAFAHCVARTVRTFPVFRSTLPNDEVVREHRHLNLGIAVGRTNGDLVTAVVADADTLAFEEFINSAQERIRAARTGADQATDSTQLLLTYLGNQGVIDAIPVLVSPAIAVIFLGSSFQQEGDTVANIVLTFDHRLINGAEAARFLGALVEEVERLST